MTDYFIDYCFEAGEEEGIKAGNEEGYEAGNYQGTLEGTSATKAAIFKNLLVNTSLPLEKIATCIELSVTEVYRNKELEALFEEKGVRPSDVLNSKDKNDEEKGIAALLIKREEKKGNLFPILQISYWQGEKEGKAKGYKESMPKAKAIARAKSRAEVKAASAINLLNLDVLSIDEIAKNVGLTIEEIKEIEDDLDSDEEIDDEEIDDEEIDDE